MTAIVMFEQVPTTFTSFPSSAKIVPEPLGVVLIISTWNYPFCMFLSLSIYLTLKGANPFKSK